MYMYYFNKKQWKTLKASKCLDPGQRSPRFYVYPESVLTLSRVSSGDLEPQHFLPKWPLSPLLEPCRPLPWVCPPRVGCTTCAHITWPQGWLFGGCVTGIAMWVRVHVDESMRNLQVWNRAGGGRRRHERLGAWEPALPTLAGMELWGLWEV